MNTPAKVYYLRDTDLAERYNVSRNTVWRWHREGRIPSPIRLAPQSTRWKLAELEAWEASRAEVPL